VITNGTGQGEHQLITSVNSSTNTLTLGGKWDIAPDSSSTVMISYAFDNTVMYENNIDGFSNYSTKNNASCGVNMYGTMLDPRIVNNTIQNVMVGIRCIPQYTVMNSTTAQNGGLTANPPYAVITGSIMENNTIANSLYGIFIYLEYTGDNMTKDKPIPMHVSINNVIRGNSIKNSVMSSTDPDLSGTGGDGIMIGSDPISKPWQVNNVWPGDWITNTVIENNIISDVKDAYIHLQIHQGETILRNNTSGAGVNVYKQDNGAATPIVVNGTFSVLPSTASVWKGANRAFTVSVAPSQTVTWSISGDHKADTTISRSGVLTVGSDETATTLTVKAISTADTSKFGTATVAVKTLVPAGAVKASSVSYNTVKLTWNAVSGASGYQVYRAASPKGSFSLVAYVKTASYSNTSLTTGIIYFYKVRTCQTNGKTNIYSAYSPKIGRAHV
jgi:hypothetical protein